MPYETGRERNILFSQGSCRERKLHWLANPSNYSSVWIRTLFSVMPLEPHCLNIRHFHICRSTKIHIYRSLTQLSAECNHYFHWKIPCWRWADELFTFDCTCKPSWCCRYPEMNTHMWIQLHMGITYYQTGPCWSAIQNGGKFCHFPTSICMCIHTWGNTISHLRH